MRLLKAVAAFSVSMATADAASAAVRRASRAYLSRSRSACAAANLASAAVTAASLAAHARSRAAAATAGSTGGGGGGCGCACGGCRAGCEVVASSSAAVADTEDGPPSPGELCALSLPCTLPPTRARSVNTETKDGVCSPQQRTRLRHASAHSVSLLHRHREHLTRHHQDCCLLTPAPRRGCCLLLRHLL